MNEEVQFIIDSTIEQMNTAIHHLETEFVKKYPNKNIFILAYCNTGQRARKAVEKLENYDQFSALEQLKGSIWSIVGSAIFGLILAAIFKKDKPVF